MRRLALFCLLLLPILSACAPAAEAAPTPLPTVDTSIATAAIGWVIVRERQGAKSAHIFVAPEPTAAILGDVPIGINGTLLGFNAAGAWVLVKIGGLTGWMPTAVLVVTSDY